ncbi:MAG: ATP-binding protein, partial [Clostridia bacterium]|nr:ATP-binding protein [Clostridia bacterium]
NGSGKSSVLEGIFLIMGNGSPETLKKIQALRGMQQAAESANLWESLFYRLDASQKMEAEALWNEHQIRLTYVREDAYTIGESGRKTYSPLLASSAQEDALRYSFSVDGENRSGHLFANGSQTPEIDSAFLRALQGVSAEGCLLIKAGNGAVMDETVLAEAFGKLELAGKQQMAVDALRMIDPSVAEIKTIVHSGLVQLYLRTDTQMIPLKLFGDGMCKLLYLVLMVLGNPGGLVLIDEVENGLHCSMQEKFWRVLAETAHRSDTQIVATTHSYECIRHAVDGIEKAGMLREFLLQRLERTGEENKAVRYDGELLKEAVRSVMEVR